MCITKGTSLLCSDRLCGSFYVRIACFVVFIVVPVASKGSHLRVCELCSSLALNIALVGVHKDIIGGQLVRWRCKEEVIRTRLIRFSLCRNS